MKGRDRKGSDEGDREDNIGKGNYISGLKFKYLD